MAVLAEGLPVFFVPEQTLITPMRKDVVNHCRRGELSFSLALDTKRMPLKILETGFSPPRVVSSGVSAAAQAICAPYAMILAKDIAFLGKFGTAGIPAGTGRNSWHRLLLSPVQCQHVADIVDTVGDTEVLHRAVKPHN